ncbi:MAG: flagellar basal body protein FliL [Helicobacteraceae bacterium CG2_30_36_10]|nr:MAG: flagellar basal body protein FliL [Helicobacteraceae bacterium CG2_30_36_10]
MADKESSVEDVAPVEKKSKNMLMIIIIVVLILIILVGAVVSILLMGGNDEVASSPAPRVQVKSISNERRNSSISDMGESRKLSQIGVLYPLDTFTVNLKSDSGRRYLKVTMSLELEGAELSLELDSKAPVIRDRVIRILTSKSLEEISSKKGKQKISDQIMDTLNAMISDGQIKGIYFTEFVIQ